MKTLRTLAKGWLIAVTTFLIGVATAYYWPISALVIVVILTIAAVCVLDVVDTPLEQPLFSPPERPARRYHGFLD